MRDLVRDHPLIAGLSVAYFLGIGVWAHVSGHDAAVVYLVVMPIQAFIVGAVYARGGKAGAARGGKAGAARGGVLRLPRFVIIGLSVWGLAHMLGGLLVVGDGVLYTKWLIDGWLRFDQVVHAFGFGISTLIVWEYLRTWLGEREPTIGLAVVAALGGMGVGAINEVFEFWATLLLPETNVGGYENTGWDLVANMVGAVTAATFARRTARQVAAS